MTLTTANLLQISNVTKRYSTVIANNDVSLNLFKGQIHALLGENGAGKSTLVKIIYGLVKPDVGDMILNNKVYAPENPKKARMSGVGMVFQHFSLFDALTVSQNVLLGMDKSISHNSLMDQIVDVSTSYGLPLNPNRIVGEGDTFKYNFNLLANVINAYAQSQFKYNKIDFYLAVSVSNTQYQREGLYQNGGFPDNSLGVGEKLTFTGLGAKGGLIYKVTGKHLLDLNSGITQI